MQETQYVLEFNLRTAKLLIGWWIVGLRKLSLTYESRNLAIIIINQHHAVVILVIIFEGGFFLGIAKFYH